MSAAPNVSISVPPDQLAALRESLTPQQFKQAQYQIVKRTTSALVRILKKKVREETVLAPKYINRVIGVTVKGDPPEGIVRISRRSIPLIAFRPTAIPGQGIVVQLTKGEPLFLHHAFLAKLASGHRGVFMRQAGAGKGFTRKGYSDRYPIVEAMGPQITSIVNIPKIKESIQFDVKSFMAKTALSQLARFAARQPITNE